MIYNEGGINWAWFTEFDINSDDTVTINRHYRLHKYDMQWPELNLKAPRHPEYYHERVWREAPGRIAIEYNVPGKGWLCIANPKMIFEYE